jgi:hypothetical protein
LDFTQISAVFANIITLLALIHGKSDSKTISSMEEYELTTMDHETMLSTKCFCLFAWHPTKRGFRLSSLPVFAFQ